MKRNIFTLIFLLGVLMFCVTVSANAQTDLNGRYVYKYRQGDVLYNFALEFEGKNAVYYSFNYEGSGTIRGDWTLENGIIKIVLTRGSSSWTFKLKKKGVDLKVLEVFPQMEIEELSELREMVIAKGIVFKKDLSEPNAPTLSIEEISKRVLRLTKSINAFKDLSPENTERQMQIKVSFNEADRNQYGFGGNIENAPDWSYNLHAYSSSAKAAEPTDTLRFSFDYQLREPVSPNLTLVCAVDFEDYREELKEADFLKSFPIYGVHSRLIGWHFERGETLVNAALNGGWQPYPQQCLKSLSITITR